MRPPVQPELRRGDIMIRDLRLWHAGMPNSSDEHRIMLGLGYMVGDKQYIFPSEPFGQNTHMYLLTLVS